jgi:16S rRNA (cytosine967-C5)-methyltransferase
MDRPDRSPPLSAGFAAAAQAIAHRLSGGQGATTPRTPAVTDLIYRGTRYWGLAQVRCGRLAQQKPDSEILALLAMAWAAIDQARREPYVVVDEAVAAAKLLMRAAGRSHAAAKKISGFVNALLRASLSDPVACAKDHEQPIARWNAPTWWIERIYSDYKDRAEAVLDALTTRAPLTVRLCEPYLYSQQFIEALSEKGLAGHRVGRHAVAIEPAVPVTEIPGFSQGWASVQDSAAQLVIDPVQALCQRLGRPPKILDACAAPGGKTFAIAQSVQAEIWAADVSSARLKRMRDDWARIMPTAQSSVRFVLLDVLDESAWRKEPGLDAGFDAILLDAPCTGSGITRRQPEIPWRRDLTGLKAVVDIQRRMLDTLWRRLLPGGELIFVTCSVFVAEGEAQESAFLGRTPDARLLPSPGRLLPVTDAECGNDQDGFFYARFQKQKHDGPDAGLARRRHADVGPGHPG